MSTPLDGGTYELVGWDYIMANGKNLKGKFYLDTGSPCESVNSVSKIRLLLKGDA